jgi:hypothetical protein
MFYLSILGFIILVSSDNPQGHDSDLNALTWYGTGGLLKGLYSHTWISINETEALDYYSPYEICKMQISTGNGCIQEEGKPSLDACGSYGRGVVHTNNECSNPSGAFLRHESITPDSFNFVHLVRSILSEGSHTLAIIGDSVASQSYSDAYCSISRANFDMKIIPSDDLKGILQGFEVIPPKNISQKSYDAFNGEFSDVISKDSSGTKSFFQVLYSHADRQPEVEQKTKPFVNSLIEKSSVADNKEIKGYNFKEKSIIETNLQYIGINKKIPIHKIQTEKDTKANLSKAVFLVNMGLHFRMNNEDELRREFKELLDILVPAVLKGHRVYFRETSAQHFRGGGSYESKTRGGPKISNKNGINSRKKILFPSLDTPSLNYSSELNFRCHPIMDEKSAYLQNWRNRIASEMISETNANISRYYKHLQNTIKIIPFYNITLPRYDYHVNSMGDCTHFCFGPMVFAPIWNNLVRSFKNMSMMS